MDEDCIFDNNDTVIISKQKISLEKRDQDVINDKFMKDKFKNLNGNWVVSYVDEDENIVTDKSLIDDNEDEIYQIYLEIKEKMAYSTIFMNITYSNLYSFITSSKNYTGKIDTEWCTYEEYINYGLKKPCLNEWASHNIIQLHSLYVYLVSTFTSSNFGSVSSFIEYAYNCSYKEAIPFV